MNDVDAVTAPHPLWQTLKHAKRLASRHYARARSMGRSGYFSGAQWIELLIAFDGCCAYCGVASERLEPDHMTPLVYGGSNAITNIVPACARCNRAKGPRRADAFVSRARMTVINIHHPFRHNRTGDPL